MTAFVLCYVALRSAVRASERWIKVEVVLPVHAGGQTLLEQVWECLSLG